MQQNCAAHRCTSLAACAIGFGTSANVQSKVLPSRRIVVTAFKSIVSYRGKYAFHCHNLEHEDISRWYEDRSGYGIELPVLLGSPLRCARTIHNTQRPIGETWRRPTK